jgi:dynein heavy chain
MILIRSTQSANEVVFSLENAMTLGYPVLLENIGEEIDSVFESVLQ